MKTSIVQVLVVEDYEPFRRFVCSTLGQVPGLVVVSEVSDGLEAVHQAEALQPDLVVLDIGLPTLNGIEAARRIRKLSPESKILFVSQESCSETIEEAFRLGAWGFVVKSRSGTDLLPAVEALRQGRQFVGSGLSGHDSTQAYAQPPSGGQTEVGLPSATQVGGVAHTHAAQFYSDDAALLAGFAVFIESALNAGNVVMVFATGPHLNSIFRRLKERGVDCAAAVEQGRYIPMDVVDTFLAVMVNELPERARLLRVMDGLVKAAAKAANGKPFRIAACGECAPVLWAQGKPDAAIQIEHLFDEIAKMYHMNVLCGYVMTNLQREQERYIYEGICAEHSAVSSE